MKASLNSKHCGGGALWSKTVPEISYTMSQRRNNDLVENYPPVPQSPKEGPFVTGR